MTIHSNNWYLVDFRSGAFTAMHGSELIEKLKIQKNRLPIETRNDIINISNPLPKGYVN